MLYRRRQGVLHPQPAIGVQVDCQDFDSRVHNKLIHSPLILLWPWLFSYTRKSCTTNNPLHFDEEMKGGVRGEKEGGKEKFIFIFLIWNHSYLNFYTTVTQLYQTNGLQGFLLFHICHSFHLKYSFFLLHWTLKHVSTHRQTHKRHWNAGTYWKGESQSILGISKMLVHKIGVIYYSRVLCQSN